MAEGSIDRPSTAGPPPAEGFPSNPVTLGLIAGIVMAVAVSTASLTAIFQGKQIGGIVGIGATAALIGAAFRVKKAS